ncbi:exosortase-associated protein EpsI, V-type [Rhizorhabdus dicambivorans]|uniref:EpsI family protein n=1 Tax=Rhizorhabdus dicambivorans TaxID=1850238 RepID=A0A2A4FWR4_9SPHN|nr:exosortase-associated protein EpsI, V-type [Rhizorhabdus dicambivorans]ATE66987.1 EpsI family protein [Rhizorhabdus dicambivorans]PCE42138.1 EpsI family protein [Rhizorhabdus dicambivorans]
MSDEQKGMPLITRRSMIAGGLLLGAAGIANSRRPDEPFKMLPEAEPRLNPLFPWKIADWEYQTSSGLVLPPPDQLSDRLYNAIITRYYASPTNLPVMMLVAYNGVQDGMLQVHRPEVCYPAAGYQIEHDRFIPLDAGGGVEVPGHYLAARSTSRHEQMIYWTRIGNDFPVRWWQQHWSVAKENLKGRVPDGVLIRFSTAAPDDETAIRTLRRFIGPLFRQLSPKARRLLFGEAGAPAPRG